MVAVPTMINLTPLWYRNGKTGINRPANEKTRLCGRVF